MTPLSLGYIFETGPLSEKIHQELANISFQNFHEESEKSQGLSPSHFHHASKFKQFQDLPCKQIASRL